MCIVTSFSPRNSLMFLSGQVASVSSGRRGQRQETWHQNHGVQRIPIMWGTIEVRVLTQNHLNLLFLWFEYGLSMIWVDFEIISWNLKSSSISLSATSNSLKFSRIISREKNVHLFKINSKSTQSFWWDFTQMVTQKNKFHNLSRFNINSTSMPTW